MTVRRIFLISTAMVVTTIALIPTSAPVAGQAAPAAPARYDMDVGTTSGFAVLAGGGRPNIMEMMRGGGGSRANHELLLRLGTQTRPNGGAAPQADHFLPEGARMGASVPLVTPTVTPSESGPANFERPRGRLLIYWGCGATVGAGQPVIIDFARLAAGQVPPNLFSATVPMDRSVRFSNSRTFGEWPNDRTRARVTPESSILGAHRIAGKYSPEIAFSLTQDFMAPLNARTAAGADGSQTVSWAAVPGATGYYAWTIGAARAAGGRRGRGADNDVGDIVWWASSASQEFGGGLWDWLSPATVANLVRQRVVMPPTQTSCQIPADVVRASGEGMFGSLIGYGPEANFAFPPRPANARTPWNPVWSTRVRYRSVTSWIPGMEGMASAEGSEARPNPNCPQPRRRRGLGGVLGGVIGAATGSGSGSGNGC
jgi:hypothetical protein